MRALRRIGSGLLVVGLVVGLCASCGLKIGGPRYGDEVDGIGCDSGASVDYQATVQLWLVTDAGREGPTEGVGSTGSTCNYWVRTESDEGAIHIRAPHPVSPTLDTFFKIWDLAIPQGSGNSQPFCDAAAHGRILVDGKDVLGGPSAVTLTDGEVIQLIAPKPAASNG